MREVTAGIEPAIELLQSPALTTWLRHQTRHGMEPHECPHGRERKTGVEPATFSLARRRATTAPLPHKAQITPWT